MERSPTISRPGYDSECSGSSNCSLTTHKACSVQRKRALKRHRHWVSHKEFSNADAALGFVRKEKIWSIKVTNDTCEGLKVYYRCNQVKKSESQCRAELHLHYIPRSEVVKCYRTPFEHEHGLKERKVFTLEIKNLINALIEQGKRPLQIASALKAKGFKLDPRQLKNYLSRYKKKRYGEIFASIEDLLNWCETHSQIPESDAEPFVVEHEILKQSDATLVRILITTKILLTELEKSQIWHVTEAKSFRSNSGLSTIFIGLAAPDQRIKPVAVALMSSALREDYLFLFRTISSVLPNKKIRLLDSSDEITRTAFCDVFGAPIDVVVSFLNRMDNFRLLINAHVHMESRAEILADISILFGSVSLQTLDETSADFVRKWKDRESFFVAFFQSQLLAFRNCFVVLQNYTSDYQLRNHLKWMECHKVGISDRFLLHEVLFSLMDSVRKWSLIRKL